ncbi:MAG: beta-lactamase family protein, partial [Cytophagaceae bacterium]|nr:beta-lactamase family protein [Cytophagaceae bacterium]
MKKFARSRFTLVLFVFAGPLARAQQLPAFVRDSLDRYIELGLKDWQIPGLSIAIIKDGRVILAKGYGVREMGKSDKVDENTLFMIGSNTKAFTATALAMLEADKKLTLNDPVTKHLPDFKLYDPAVTRQVTLTDLLGHRLGLRTFQGDFTYWTSNLSRQEVIQKFGLNKPLYGFRTRYGYCNAGFVTAGEVVPIASGGTLWEDFIREKIFKPLGMNRALALSAEIIKATNAAVSHTWYEGQLLKLPYPAIDNLAPAGSLSSSAREHANWLLMQLDTGRFEGKQVVPKEAILKTWTPQTIVNTDKSTLSPNQFGLYGLGWFINDYAGRRLISHDGGVDGFVSTTCF